MGFGDCYNRKKETFAQIQELRDLILEESKKQKDSAKTDKKIYNLFNTEAGQMAIEMALSDGKFDLQISAERWNAYAEGHEGRTTISDSISIFDAMDSITTYMVREEARENGLNVERTEKEDPNIDYD